MKKILLLAFLAITPIVFSSCEDFFDKIQDKLEGEAEPVLLSDLVGTWGYVCSANWDGGEITIDSNGNFTLVITHCGVTPMFVYDTTTGKMSITDNIITIAYDGGVTVKYPIRKSVNQENVWLIDPFKNGIDYIAIGEGCHGSWMMGGADW